MNNYYAEYTFLINGATWGKEERDFEAETDEEAVDIALSIERTWLRVYDNGHIGELLLDTLSCETDEGGREIEINREGYYNEINN